MGFCALLAELGARLVLEPARYHRGPIELDAELGFRGVPGSELEVHDERGAFTVRLNGSGFRGRELPVDADAQQGERRVVFVGDSFLVGQQVRDEQLLSELTEAALQGQGVSASVYNLSGVDYGTAQQLLLLRRDGPRIRPSEVVLFFYSGNDVINNSLELAGTSTVSAGDYIRPYLVGDGDQLERRYTHPFRAWLRNASRLFAGFERASLGLSVSGQVPWFAPWPALEGPAQRLRTGLPVREDFEIFRGHHPEHRWERAWRSTEALLRAFQRECDALGARLLVVVVPNVHQVMRTAKGARLDIGSRLVAKRRLAEGIDWDLPDRRLRRFFESAGIEARLLLPHLRRAAKEQGPVYGRDEHFSASGHAEAARVVLRWLRGDPPESLEGWMNRRPVAVLPDSDTTPPRLDFREWPHEVNLGDGWLRWDAAASGDDFGWLPGGPALLVLPPGPGQLVIRGTLSSLAKLPVRGSVEILGVPRHTFTLDSHGVFEVRLPPRASQEPYEVSRDGYVAIEFAPGAPGEIRVHEVGFEAS